MPAQLSMQQMAAAFLQQMAAMSSQPQYSAGLPSGTPTNLHLYGPGGLFSSPGLNQRVFSALSLPTDSLASRLPMLPGDNIVDALHSLITAVDDTTGAEPAGVCDDPPTAGFIRGCTIRSTS